ncbi:phosphoenolpyruvate carboxylase [Georgenia sp. Z1344]|uniref:phosphoenolpyruvate carboxylase n=1 Tax=Georgenia sp. Z1344 TaxID=3416706 RepID=UPI003CEA1D46
MPSTGTTTTTPNGTASGVPDAMRADVRLLGNMLGQVLKESGSEGLYDDVETLRELVIDARRASSATDIARAEEVVAGFTPERAIEVARAFSCYFHLANLAEEQQRVRVLRETEGGGSRGFTSPSSLPGAVRALADEVGEEEARRRLGELRFHPVFTAHPTEARRRAVTRSIRTLGELIDARDDDRLGPFALAEIDRELLAAVDTLWRTAELRPYSPGPLDEVRTLMQTFDSSLVDVIPAVYRRLDDALDPEGAGIAEPVAPAFVRLGSWIGGDRDGNPNVVSPLTIEASRIMSEHALATIGERTRHVAMHLTVADSLVAPADAVSRLWQMQRQLSPALAEQVASTSPGETHRRVLLFVAGRLDATRERDADLAYADPEEALDDIRTVRASLAAAGAHRAANGDIADLERQLVTFGFHGAELEMRQHSKVHRQALAILDGEVDPEEHPPAVPVEEVLDTMRAVALVQRRLGEGAAGRYLVSFTQSSEDIANVYRLARIAAGDGRHAPVIDVVPLFETFEDLRNAPRILTEMLDIPDVQERLAANGRQIEVTLGYSDSAKDVGPVAATIALYDAQRQIADWAKEHDIALTQFHGRGGALGRGGGPAHRAVLAQPPHSVDLRFKVTEQGEVISARYFNQAIGIRHIESVAAATLMASAPSVERRNAEAAERFAELAERLTTTSRERFDALVGAEGFPAWFAQVTPQEEVGHLAIGSRPAKRGLSVESLDDLRAIPWNFAWSQARTNLTGWFGLGTALAEVGDVELLRSAYAQWPLFATMVDNIEMSLAKADDLIAARYLALGDREDLSAMVLEELELTRRWVLEVTGQDELLQSHRVLGRAVALRNPYIDALSLLQLRALRVLRGDVDEVPDEVHQLLLITLKGAAAGLQNTG